MPTVYLLVNQHECSDHYYPDYHTIVRIYAEEGAAMAEAERLIARARERNLQMQYYVEARDVLSAGEDAQTLPTPRECYRAAHTFIEPDEVVDID